MSTNFKKNFDHILEPIYTFCAYSDQPGIVKSCIYRIMRIEHSNRKLQESLLRK